MQITINLSSLYILLLILFFCGFLKIISLNSFFQERGKNILYSLSFLFLSFSFCSFSYSSRNQEAERNLLLSSLRTVDLSAKTFVELLMNQHMAIYVNCPHFLKCFQHSGVAIMVALLNMTSYFFL